MSEINSIATRGSAGQVNISLTQSQNMRIPLPPLNEVERIIKEIVKYDLLIEAIEYETTDLQTIIISIKNKILDLAIHGKLVPQDPNDEPALDLLKRINPNFTPCDNGHYGKIPFEQPSSWVWCRLGDVVSIKSGDSISVRNNQDGKYPIYGGNGINGYYCDNNVETGTIIIGRVGFYCGSVHMTESKAWVTDNAFIVCYKNVFNPIYLSYLLRWLQLNKTSNSTAQPVISGKGIYPLLIPIPPITEQQRIVDAIDNINSKLDAIMESL
jgi:type I restriction enzyme S subunit